MNVGYVGLGNMGGALAHRLMLKTKLRVYDLRPDVTAEFAKAGAIPAQNLESLARECDIVMTCLPTSKEVRAVVFGPGGLLAGLKPGSIVADMTTGDPVATREMAVEAAKHGIVLVDCPVSGGPHGATAGTIALMVGAPADVFAALKPALEIISPNIFHCGDVGAGHTMKLVNNVIAASVRAITFEAVTMGVKNGLSLAACAEVLNKGSAQSYSTAITLPRLVSGEFDANFAMGLMHKDVRLATECGLSAASPMPISNLVREIFLTAANELGGGVDVNNLIRWMERNARVTVVTE
jgi:3-hydroxyisobutyrate dehydrogenase